MNPKKKGKEEEEEIFSLKFILVFQILNTIPKYQFIERVGRRIC
jgi:hypothetical protein